MAPNVQSDENFGWEFESSGDAVILPGTFKPLTDDFFFINHTGNQRLFKITNVEVDKLNGEKYFKIQFQLAREEKALLDEQIETDFVSYYENIGTEKRSIIEKADSILIDKLSELKDNLIDRYNQCFLNSKYNIYLFKYNDTYIYNEYCIRFIKNTKCFERKAKLYSSIYIQDILEDQVSLYDTYMYTIYNAIEKLETTTLRSENFKLYSLYEDINTPFFSDPEKYAQCFFVNRENENKKELMLVPIVRPFGNKLINNIINNIHYKTNNNFLENIIIDYFNNKIIIDYEFIKKIKQNIFKPDLTEFLLMPCLIYIINEAIKKLFDRKEMDQLC